jgi:hypothetical protein
MTTEITYNKRLGWVWTDDILNQTCKRCGDPTLHTANGWRTRNCKPVMVPDQWEGHMLGMQLEELPPYLGEDDVTLLPLWETHDEDLEAVKNGG